MHEYINFNVELSSFVVFLKQLIYVITGTADQYELGDLGDKYGLLDNTKSVTTYFNETQLSLFGPYSILGRSVVLHKRVRMC